MTTISNNPSFGNPPEPNDSETCDDGLTLPQKFDLAIMQRKIDDCRDIEELRRLTKTTTTAWYVLKCGIANKMLEKLIEYTPTTYIPEEAECQIAADTTASASSIQTEIGEDSDPTAPTTSETPKWSAAVQSIPYETQFQPKEFQQ